MPQFAVGGRFERMGGSGPSVDLTHQPQITTAMRARVFGRAQHPAAPIGNHLADLKSVITPGRDGSSRVLGSFGHLAPHDEEQTREPLQ